jgi:uncharacterized protein GlcG (DUF336 family)
LHLLLSLAALSAADLPSKKYLNLSAIKTMVAAAEAEADKRNVQVSICVVDDSGNFLFSRGEMAPRSARLNSRKGRLATLRFTKARQKRRRTNSRAATWPSSRFPVLSPTKAACQ